MFDETSSSSSDEENYRLKEALDPHMFDGNLAEKTSVDKKTTKFDHKDNILHVTPEFQAFVAKHLTKILDENVLEIRQKNKSVNNDETGGIKLFQNSNELLADANFSEFVNENCSSINKKPKNKKRLINKRDSSYKNESELLENARSVAVSPQWVLDKIGVRAWSKPKGKEIVYKKNGAGELEIVKQPFVSLSE